MIDLTTSQFRERIPQYVINIAEKLQESDFEAFLVGGSIRDILLDIQPDDYDIATNAYPEDIENIFIKSIPTGAKFGTITVVTEDEKGERFDVEVTTYRSEADYIGGRWPTKVEFAKKIEDDLSRRDFTINAIALNLQEFDNDSISVQEILIDPFDGITDLRSKMIRAVRDPIERFAEDGLRSVRGCRLASQLEFEIESQTLEAMKDTMHVTKHISVERFRDELLKLLKKSPQPSKGLRLLQEVGILDIFIPELTEGIGVMQPEFHEFDVFEHSIRTVDHAEDSVKLPALFHDIAKPRTRSEDEKGIHFYGHDTKGAEMTQEIMRRLKFSNAEIEQVSKLVRWHMFYYPSADWRKSKKQDGHDPSHHQFFEPNHEKDHLGWTDAAIRRLIHNVGGEDAIDELMKLRMADATANPKNEFNPKELDALSMRIAEVREKDMAVKIADLDISGEDIIRELQMEQGKVIGDTLNYLLDLVIEDPLINKKEILMQKASEYIASSS